MEPLKYICTLIIVFYSISAYGQTEQKDSLQIHADDDIKLNEEAVRSIVFDFAPHNKSDMKISMDKPWMEFSTDLPKEYIRKTIPKMEMKLKLDLTIPYIVSTSAIGFDADKLLYETLTERGRNIRRNRKHAKAWKIYNDYVPTKEDSLKWYGNKKRTLKDTLNIMKKDSLLHEDEIYRQDKTDESRQMIPLQGFALKEYGGKDGEDN